MPDCSVHAIVTDPPYGLEFMGKEWDAPWKSGIVLHDPSVVGGFQDGAGGNAYSRSRVRYGREGQAMPMFQAWCTEWATECLRLLKPGGHLLAFGGSRTYHRLACAIEDAGFEIRDQIMWVYGSGFPKSLNVSKAIDKMNGAEPQVIGYTNPHDSRTAMARSIYGSQLQEGAGQGNAVTVPATDDARRWKGWGTALKPAHEPIVLARKPLDGTVAETVLTHGTGALNIDGCRVSFVSDEDRRESTAKNQHEDFGTEPTTDNTVYGDYSMVQPTNYNPPGRWPANFIHDGSDEVLELFPETAGGARPAKANKPTGEHYEGGWGPISDGERIEFPSGSAARFFYCAKANKAERNAGLTDRNHHPTVKPINLMRYLIRLVTPANGIVLDPFLGSGTTAVAAIHEGVEWIGFEINPEYGHIAERRAEHARVATCSTSETV
jgi:site-specific DNA-methyltransferase (adenine-specific)